MKILVNKCYGGFGLSDTFKKMFPQFNEYDVDRTDKVLLACVEAVGLKNATGEWSELAIVEIPDEATDWELDEYDGLETVIYVVDGKIYRA